MATDPSVYIDNIIKNAIATAESQTKAATDAADDLVDENIGFYVEQPPSETNFEVEAVEPEIPKASDALLTYDAQVDKIVALLSDQLADFFATYYPLASDAFDEATNSLVNTITNGGTGINASVEAQLWQRMRENIVTDGRRVEAQIEVGYAAKGHMLPQGSMTKKIDEARYAQIGASGQAATTVAVQQFEREVQAVQFAIEQAMNSRKMAMDAAADYIRAVASAPDSAVRTADLKDANQARLMQAASAWYGTRLSRDQLILNSKLAEMDGRRDVWKIRRTNATQNDEVKVRALGAAADVYARSASAALSSLNTVASTAVNAFS